MTLRELINGKTYPYIEYRFVSKEVGDLFFGICKSENGNIISLDGDSYRDDTNIDKYEEWVDDNGDTCLTVWEVEK